MSADIAELAGHRLRLVDVGGAGGLQDAWKPYAGQLFPILFEPNPDEAAKLRQTLVSQYGSGLVLETGLSNTTCRQPLNIARYWGCSSMREPNWSILSKYRIAPAFQIERQVVVDCTRYDQLFQSGVVPAPDAIKVDVQGFEYEVLQGFGGLLQGCLGIELETHVYPMYERQRLMHEIVAFMADFGFVLRKIEPVPSFDGDVVELNAWFSKDIRYWRDLDPSSRHKFATICQVWGLLDYARIDPAAPHTQF